MTSSKLLHVFDLPQLYTRPPAASLLHTLQVLQKTNTGFDGTRLERGNDSAKTYVDPSGVPGYLTTIISSPLAWLADDEREMVWEAASQRLSERAGRSAAPSMTRSFRIDDGLTLDVHEPSLTEDSLGLKTWTASLLLSRRLRDFLCYLPVDDPRLLELGSGTGLVGISAAVLWQKHLKEVLLTDLPEIVPNLAKNILLNSSLISRLGDGFQINSRVLDWSNDEDSPVSQYDAYSLIIAADPIYSPEHPRILVDTVRRWLKPNPLSHFIVEFPIREAYSKERQDLHSRLQETMDLVKEGTEVGYDDWEDSNGQPAEVRCQWSVWRYRG